MNDLMKYTSKSVTLSKSKSGAVGKALTVTGGTGLALVGVAAVLPFVNIVTLLVILTVIGIFMWE